MSTYASETADNLRTSLESLYSQTIVPERIVLVIDGAIDHDQETVLSAFSSDPRGPKLTLVRLPQNGGLAAAMNAGLAYCDCHWSAPTRWSNLNVNVWLAFGLLE
jgi:glycosyltransferase involved in cell wall biosynthesis